MKMKKLYCYYFAPVGKTYYMDGRSNSTIITIIITSHTYRSHSNMFFFSKSQSEEP